MLGIATPLGFVGAELEARLARWLSVSAGVGLAASGVQGAVMARPAIPIGDDANVYLGLGASAGRWVWFEFPPDEAQKTWNIAYWANAELGVWYRYRSPAWSGRLFLGYSRILNRDGYECTQEVEHCMEAHTRDGENLIYVGYSVARSFD